MRRIVWRHYGDSGFINEKFKPISKWQHSFTCKPLIGGLWASPVNSPRGWIDFCREEQFNLQKLQEWFDFTLGDDSKILTVNSCSDLSFVPTMTDGCWEYYDYGYLLNNEYDGIYLTLEGLKDTYLTDDFKGACLRGWDCESILIFNKNIINYEYN